jgi:hypothetical protein
LPQTTSPLLAGPATSIGPVYWSSMMISPRSAGEAMRNSSIIQQRHLSTVTQLWPPVRRQVSPCMLFLRYLPSIC